MKKLILLLTLCMLAVPVLARDNSGTPTNKFGYTFGVLMSPDAGPVLGHVIDGQVGVKTITGNILTGVEVSLFFSQDRGDEKYAGRSFLVRDVELGKGFLAGVGVGAWDFINTDGDDLESAAFTGRVSYSTLGLRATIGGDIVMMSPDDISDQYFVFAGLAVGL